MCPAGPHCRMPYCSFVHATTPVTSPRGTGALGAPPDLLMRQETGPMTMTPGTPRGDGRVGAPPNPRLRPDAPPTSDAESSDDSPTLHLFSSEYSYTEPTPDSEQ